MDLRSVECVVKVAELGHFGRAAAELHLSQPALSHRIRTLERELGLVLFDRDRRGVRITEAGRAFLEPANAAVRQGANAVDLARRAARGEHGRLRIGFTVIASYTDLPNAVQSFRATHPDVTVELMEANSPAVEDALERGDIDIGVLHPPLQRTLTQLALPGEQLVLAIPVGSPLDQRKRIRFEHLAGMPLLAAPRSVGPVLFDNLVACFRSAGVEPHLVQEATPVTTLTGLVAAGVGIGFVTRGVARATRPGVVFRDVVDAPVVPMAIAWSGEHPAPSAQRFVAVLLGSKTQKS